MIGHVLLGVIQIVRSSKMGRGSLKKKEQNRAVLHGRGYCRIKLLDKGVELETNIHEGNRTNVQRGEVFGLQTTLEGGGGGNQKEQ